MEKVKVTVNINVSPEAKKTLQEMAMAYTLQYLDGIGTWDWHSFIPYALENAWAFEYFVNELRETDLVGGTSITEKGLENRYKRYLKENPWSCNDDPNKITLTGRSKELFDELQDVANSQNRMAALDYCNYVVVYEKETFADCEVYTGIKVALEKEKERRSRTSVGSGALDRENNE